MGVISGPRSKPTSDIAARCNIHRSPACPAAPSLTVKESSMISKHLHQSDQTDRITEVIALPVDWLVRELAPAVIARRV